MKVTSSRGGIINLESSFDITNVSPWSKAIPQDGILSITSSKTGTGYSAAIYINDVVSDVIFFGDGITIENQTCIVKLPVKSGDNIRITTDLPTNSPQTWRIRVDLLKYR